MRVIRTVNNQGEVQRWGVVWHVPGSQGRLAEHMKWHIVRDKDGEIISGQNHVKCVDSASSKITSCIEPFTRVL